MYREIGSEFELDKEVFAVGSGPWLPDCEDSVMTFSGRTAIEVVLRDIWPIKKALLPSYCCDSMIEPFRQAGISVDFYQVNFDGELRFDMTIPERCDLILWCNYFGFHHGYPEKILRQFRARGGIVIEDITHSLFSEHQSQGESDYLVASVRKWVPVPCGGFCGKVKGKLRSRPQTEPPAEFLSLRRQAMEWKRAYIDCGNQGDKQTFLKLYGQANALLAQFYSDCRADETSVHLLNALNTQYIKCRRRQNAAALYEGLGKCFGIRPMFALEAMDCPIFVPVVIDNGRRDTVRKKLIEEAIYCPAHWPRPNADCSSDLYDRELSLICDQRYDVDDMKRILQILNLQ